MQPLPKMMLVLDLRRLASEVTEADKIVIIVCFRAKRATAGRPSVL